MSDSSHLNWSRSALFQSVSSKSAQRILLSGVLMTALSGCTVLDSLSSNADSTVAATASTAASTPAAVEANPAATLQAVDQEAATSPPETASESNFSTEPSASSPSEPLAESSTESPTPEPQADPYPDAVKKASLALALSQSAQSTDDWRLVAGRWQQAIDLMEAVPNSSENYGSVASNLTEYRRKRDHAKTQANIPIPTTTQLSTAVIISPEEDSDGETAASTLASNQNPELAPALSSTQLSPNSPLVENEVLLAPPLDPIGAIEPIDEDDGEETESADGEGLYLAPIVRRSGGTPVIHVTFNGEYTVEMIVDTGASGTVLTRNVAQALGIQPIGQTNMATANAQNVPFLLGRVESIEVNGAEISNSVVAIAGPDLDTGLLGHDFFGNYDVTVKSDVVEFRER